MQQLILITLIVVFIVDLSGFPQSLKGALSRFIGRKVQRIKPFDCSLCMVWWVGLLWIILSGQFTLINVVMVAGCAFFANVVAELLRLVKDAILFIIIYLGDLL